MTNEQKPDQREVMRLALDALSRVDRAPVPLGYKLTTHIPQAIAALRQALSAPPESVAAVPDKRCQCCGYLVTESEHRGCLRAAAPTREPLDGWQPVPTEITGKMLVKTGVGPGEWKTLLSLAPTAPACEPLDGLTVQNLKSAWLGDSEIHDEFEAGVRYAEQAHGITPPSNTKD